MSSIARDMLNYDAEYLKYTKEGLKSELKFQKIRLKCTPEMGNEQLIAELKDALKDIDYLLHKKVFKISLFKNITFLAQSYLYNGGNKIPMQILSPKKEVVIPQDIPFTEEAIEELKKRGEMLKRILKLAKI